MKICTLCNKEVEVDKFFGRKSECPHCGGDLHICLNCRFYSETSHNKCIEPKAEFQRARDKANFCDYFQYRDSGSAPSGRAEPADDVKKKFESLFK